MSVRPHRDLACQARASYGQSGWTVAIRERDTHPPAPREENIDLVGEHFDPGHASRTLFERNWQVLGDPRPQGEWTHQDDGSWIAYVDDAPGCPRPTCETKVYGCRWPYEEITECEIRHAFFDKKGV